MATGLENQDTIKLVRGSGPLPAALEKVMELRCTCCGEYVDVSDDCACDREEKRSRDEHLNRSPHAEPEPFSKHGE